MAGLNLLFLGPPRIVLDGKDVILRRRKVLALLAYLAVTARPHDRDQLAEVLYPEADRERAAAGLRQSLSYLRESLGTRWVESHPGAVSLPPATGLFLDVAEFRRLAKRAGTAAAGPASEDGLDVLARAARLYRGPFLASFYLKDSPGFEQWQANLEEALRQEYAGTLERLAEGHRRRGTLEAAADWARAAVDLDPLEESAHRRLMTILAAAGKRQQALRQYERCRAILAESLDAKPDAETEALRVRIVEGRAGAERRDGGGTTAATVPAEARPEAAPGASPFLLASAADDGPEPDVRSAFPTAAAAFAEALELARRPAAARRGRRDDRPRSPRPGRRVAIHAGDGTGADPASVTAAEGPWSRAASLLRAVPPGQVLVSDAAARFARDSLPAGAALRSLGNRQLDDLGPPCAIWRLAHPGLPSRAVPPRTLDVHPGNLRPMPGSLVGRGREIEAIVALVRGGSAGIVTLTGPGGSGKTRLALHAAARLSLRFEHGAFFVDLAVVREPAHVAPAVGSAVGLRQSPGDSRPVRDLLLDVLGRRNMLLVLDNFEHLLPAAPLVADIAAACGGVRIIVTSREPLHLRDETEVAVPPLGLGEPGTGAPVAECEAVRLFAERAKAADSRLAPLGENGAVVADICRSLDGLPLAIELAAPWLKILPATVLLERLSRRLELLSHGPADLPERQRSLRSEIAWSHDLLDDGEQRLFRRLAVFPGSFGLEAAEAVASMPRTMDHVASLADKNLLRRQHEGSAPRLRMLETIREFAAERLDTSGEAGEVRSRFAAWALRTAEEASGHLLGPEQDEWFGRLETEDDNLSRALSLMIDRRQAADGMRLAAALGWFWFRRGRFTSGAQWLEKALGICDEPVAGAVRAKVHCHLGWMRLMLGGTFAGNTEAGESFRAGLALAEEAGDRRLQAVCQGWLAWCEADLPSTRRFAMADGAVAVARGAADPWALSLCLTLAHSHAPRTDEAPGARKAALEEAIRLAQHTGDPFLVCQALHGMGDVHLHLNDDEAAEPWFLASLERAEEIGDAWSAFDARSHLAWGWLKRGDTGRAGRSFAEALRAAAAGGARPYVAQFLHGLAIIAKRKGDAVRALRLGGAASAIRYHGHPRWDPRLAEETGLPRGAVEKEWSAGSAMGVDAAVRLALEEA